MAAITTLRTDDTSWAQLAALFPEYAESPAPQAIALIGRTVDPADSARRSRRMKVFSFAPGLLQGPRFMPGTAWLSGTVAHVAEAGLVGPGWCEAALGRPDPETRQRARPVMDAIVAARVGGSFWAPEVTADSPDVLVCAGPGAGPGVLDDALAGHRAVDLLVLAAEGELAATARRRGCTVVTTAVDPWSAIERARVIFLSGDHPAGVLARFMGRAVHGTAWPASRPDAVDIAAAWLAGTRHADPFTGRPASAEATIALLASWRDQLRANRGIACCVGISGWKRRRIAAFFHDGEAAPPFHRSAAPAIAAARRAGGAIAVWNSRMPPGLLEQANANQIKIVRVEDGFVRSAGLGSDFLPPCSIIADGAGIYYDPGRPSDLETLLAETRFDPDLLARSARLIATMLGGGVTKYGSGGAAFRLPEAACGRRTILVPGQVADDLSVRLGAGPIRTNLSLLQQVRESRPDAFVIYKPHPDVEAGHRPGAIHAGDMARLADLVVRGGAMSAVIDAVDEVHTMTSLAGFEALLRGRIVHVHGQPFYAGWGLTHDHAKLARRQRRLSLEELAACVLILYPRYVDPVTSLPCGPELLIERLATPALWRPGWLMRARQLQGRLRRRLRSTRAVLAPSDR